MTATVARSFAARRGDQLRAETCPTCARRRDGCCHPHRLEILADRLRADLDACGPALLIPAADVAEVLADALTVLDGITAECLTAIPHRPTNSTRGAR